MLIKDELGATVNHFTHNGSLNFERMGVRPPFVDERKGPHDERFDLLDTYDKSTYLSNIQRTKMNLSFATHSPRDRQLIDKGGIDGNDLAGKAHLFYETS